MHRGGMTAGAKARHCRYFSVRRQVANVAGNCCGVRRKTCCPPCVCTVSFDLSAFGRASPNAEFRSARRSIRPAFCFCAVKPPFSWKTGGIFVCCRTSVVLLVTRRPARRSVPIQTRSRPPETDCRRTVCGACGLLPTGFGTGNAEARARRAWVTADKIACGYQRIFCPNCAV